MKKFNNVQEFIEEYDMLELNQQNVLAIYKDCLYKETENSGDKVKVKLYDDQSNVNYPEIFFDSEKLSKNLNKIKQLAGQLKVCHDALNVFTVSMGFINYKEQPWTRDNTTLMALYALGMHSSTFFPINKTKIPNKAITSINKLTFPAYSPTDPDFIARYNEAAKDEISLMLFAYEVGVLEFEDKIKIQEEYIWKKMTREQFQKYKKLILSELNDERIESLVQQLKYFEE